MSCISMAELSFSQNCLIEVVQVGSIHYTEGVNFQDDGQKTLRLTIQSFWGFLKWKANKFIFVMETYLLEVSDNELV